MATNKNPDFAEIAVALFELCRQEADKIEHMEFMIGKLPPAPGIEHAFNELRERNRRVAMAHDFFKALIPHETIVRQMAANGAVPIKALEKTA